MLVLDTFINSAEFTAISENIEGEACFAGADLVIEKISSDDHARDLVDKRGDYAEIGIAEYWIVNPLAQTVTVLRLDGKQ